jgi:hypothetical protein
MGGLIFFGIVWWATGSFWVALVLTLIGCLFLK